VIDQSTGLAAGRPTPNGQTDATEFFHDIQELEISAIHSLIQTGNFNRPITDVGYFALQKPLSPPFAALERLPLAGRSRCNPSSRQIRCTRLVSRFQPSRSRRRVLDQAPFPSAMAACQTPGCSARSLAPQDQQRVAGRRWVVGSFLSEGQARRCETRNRSCRTTTALRRSFRALEVSLRQAS